MNAMSSHITPYAIQEVYEFYKETMVWCILLNGMLQSIF